jgi:aspartate carbamoyltransferase catalytic subunit
LLDAIDNLVAMPTAYFCRASVETTGASEEIAKHLPSYVHVINAGDGTNQHPTQGLFRFIYDAAL